MPPLALRLVYTALRRGLTHCMLCYSLAALRGSAALVLPVSRALPLVLLEGRDVWTASCRCSLSFALVATGGDWYGTIARCALALAWRMRFAAARLAGGGALRTSVALSEAVCACGAYCTPGWVYVLAPVVGHGDTTTCV